MKTKKALFIGGVKSGKSLNAQNYILNISKDKPIYLITSEFIDREMKLRIDSHKELRGDKFITIEEPLKIYESISESMTPVLVECITMWINNMLYHDFKLEDMISQIEKILKSDKSVVFVLNDVGSGIVPDNELARKFVDISGKISQIIASGCDEVFHTIAGISTKIK